MKKLFLHIGYPKTGTSGIQRFLTTNAAALEQAGLLYPKTGILNHAHFLLHFSLDIFPELCPVPIPPAETLRAQLREEIDASPCQAAVISSEFFVTGRDIQKIRSFFSDYEVKIIIYLRRHDYMFELAFSQSEMTVQDPPWEQDICSYTLYQMCTPLIPYDYLTTLQQWKAVFGPDSLIIRPYEKLQNQPDLFADFLDSMGIANSPAYVRPGLVNSSMGPQTLYALRQVRKSGLPHAAKDKIVKRLLASDKNTQTQRLFSPAMRTAVVKKYMPSYYAIAKNFMGRENGRLFEDPLPSLSAPWTPPKAQQEQEIIKLILDAVAPLLS